MVRPSREVSTSRKSRWSNDRYILGCTALRDGRRRKRAVARRDGPFHSNVHDPKRSGRNTRARTRVGARGHVADGRSGGEALGGVLVHPRAVPAERDDAVRSSPQEQGAFGHCRVVNDARASPRVARQRSTLAAPSPLPSVSSGSAMERARLPRERRRPGRRRAQRDDQRCAPRRVDLVLVHGFANGGGCFFKQAGDLGAVGRAHLVDWRGAGMSGRPKGASKTEAEAIDYFVEGLEAWRLHRLGPEGKLCLVGHSAWAPSSPPTTPRETQKTSNISSSPDPPRSKPSTRPTSGRSCDGALLHRVFHGTATFCGTLASPQMTMRAAPFRWQRGVVDNYLRKRWRAREVLDEPTYEALVEYATGVLMMPGECPNARSESSCGPIGAARTPIGPRWRPCRSPCR